jgi:hypothetical protein
MSLRGSAMFDRRIKADGTTPAVLVWFAASEATFAPARCARACNIGAVTETGSIPLLLMRRTEQVLPGTDQGDGDWANISRSSSVGRAGERPPCEYCATATNTFTINSFETVRGRLGYAFDTGSSFSPSALLYGTELRAWSSSPLRPTTHSRSNGDFPVAGE